MAPRQKDFFDWISPSEVYFTHSKIRPRFYMRYPFCIIVSTALFDLAMGLGAFTSRIDGRVSGRGVFVVPRQGGQGGGSTTLCHGQDACHGVNPTKGGRGGVTTTKKL